MAAALVLITEGFEEMETLTPVDLLRRAGVTVTVASVKDSMHVTGRSGVTLHADSPLASVEDRYGYDMLILPGGPHVKALREDGRATALARAYALAGKRVAAICAAPNILNDAQLLTAKRFTCHPNEMIPGKEDGPRCITDGWLTTAGAAGCSLEFGMELVRLLVDADTLATVARGIDYPL